MNVKEAERHIKIWDEIVENYAQQGLPIPDDEEITKKQLFHLLSKGFLEAVEKMKPVVEALVFYDDPIRNEQAIKALKDYRREVLGITNDAEGRE